MVDTSVQDDRMALLRDHVQVMLVDLTLKQIGEHLRSLDYLVIAGGSFRCPHVILTDLAIGRADRKSAPNWI